jgi:Mg-chelatase subunit ChlD
MDKTEELSAVVEVPPGAVPQASDFHLLMDRKSVAIANSVKTFGESGNGMALVVCVDVSGSMKGGPLRDTKEALLSFIGKAASRPEDRIALISFADDALIVSSFGRSREQLSCRL